MIFSTVASSKDNISVISLMLSASSFNSTIASTAHFNGQFSNVGIT